MCPSRMERRFEDEIGRDNIVLCSLLLVGCGKQQRPVAGESPSLPVESVTSVTASEAARAKSQGTSASTQSSGSPTEAEDDQSPREGVTDGQRIDIEDAALAGPEPLTTMEVEKGPDGFWRTKATPEQLSRGTWKKEPTTATKPFKKEPGNNSPMLELEVVEVPR